MALSIRRKKPEEPVKLTENEVFRAWFADYFGPAKPDAAHFEIWKASRARALEQAARIHSGFARLAPPGSGRAYNHTVYASLIRELDAE
jgi:hypothetical protein